MFARILAATAMLVAMSLGARADAVADFYKGKSIQLVLGYGPGGGYDVYARIIARYLGKYIPGNPSVAVVNMPGAGSLRATNFLYATAPKDGLTIGAFARDMPLMGILGGNANVQFDPRKFTWLGSASSSANDAYLLFVRKDAEVKSIAQATTPGGPAIVLAGTAEGASGNDIALLLRETIDLNVKIINGYPDSGAIFLAVDRKEVDGRFVGLSAVSASKAEWLKPDGPVRALLQFGRSERNRLFADAPTARELAKDDRARALIGLAELPYQLSRPVAAPPGLPPERAKALQEAFMAMQTDADYLKEAERLGLDVSPVDGAQALNLIETLAASPQELRDFMKKLHSDK
jgi:tripartite-type tricarboxylate transporter receptor subunit TctC